MDDDLDQALSGVGEWTAQYIAMRALGESDAFLAGDVAAQRKFAVNGRRVTPRELLERADHWRPWRAYAVMHLWIADGDVLENVLPKETEHAVAV